MSKLSLSIFFYIQQMAAAATRTSMSFIKRHIEVHVVILLETSFILLIPLAGHLNQMLFVIIFLLTLTP